MQKQVLALLFGLLLLFGNAGLSLQTHYCKGEAVRSALLFAGHLKSCGMEQAQCPVSRPEGLSKASCCSESVQPLTTDAGFSFPLPDFDAGGPALVPVLAWVFCRNGVLPQAAAAVLPPNKAPPPRRRFLLFRSLLL